MSGSFHPEVWLSTAKRLPAGTTTRQPHVGDRTMRPNFIIGHDHGKYWCYCQSCGRGAVHEKSHVSVVGASAPAASTELSLPSDKVSIYELDTFTREQIAAFLVAKHVDQLFLPELHFSEGRKRILLDTGVGWLGRDTTDTSPQKWLSYSGTTHLGRVDAGLHGARVPAGCTAIVVEDPFSYYKVRWALRAVQGYTVYCALGTGVRPALALELVQHSRVLMFLDGDAAGRRGALAAQKQLKAYGTRVIPACAPEGLDPKDMTAAAIRQHVEEV